MHGRASGTWSFFLLRIVRLGVALLCMGTSLAKTYAQEQALGCVNFDPQQAPALLEAARAANLHVAPASPDDREFAGRMLIWQVQAGEQTDVTEARSQWLGEYVRRGGSLLITLGAKPGAGVLRLAFLAPTTAYYTNLFGGSFLTAQAGEWDPTFFGTNSTPPLALPLCYKLQPVSAAERGMGRYERYEMPIPYLRKPQMPGGTFWTRPLLNRDWETRIKSDDVSASALLLTDRYGAGRVAVFAGPVEQAKTGRGDANFWSPVLSWLAATTGESVAPPANETARIVPHVEVDRVRRALVVTLDNPAGALVKVTVLARIATWEQAYVGDAAQDLFIPARSAATATLPLPAVGDTAYQALNYEDRFDVRVGVLSENGADLLGEVRLSADLRPDADLTVATDDLATRPYPFAAPGPQTLFVNNRMGAPIGAYSYAPDTDARAVVRLSNGACNLAPLAATRDETTPDNPTLVAINDGFTESSKVPRQVIAYGSWRGKAGQENVLSFRFPGPVTLTSVVLWGNPGYQPVNLVHNPGTAVLECDGREVLRADDLDMRLVKTGQADFSFPPMTGKTFRFVFPVVGGTAPLEKPWLGEIQMNGATTMPASELRGHLVTELRDGLTGETMPIADAEVAVKPGEVGTFEFPFKTPPLRGQPARYLQVATVFRPANNPTADFRLAETPLLVIAPPHPLEPMPDIQSKDTLTLNFNTTAGFRNAGDVGTGSGEIKPGWDTPDDLVWAYSHQLKQIPANARMQASRLYVSSDALKPYANPWTNFSNGDVYWDVARPALLARCQQLLGWGQSSTVVFVFSDRWDNGPSVNSLYTWPELQGFDEFLRANRLPPLQGRTRAEVIADLQARYAGRFHGWQLDRYTRAVSETVGLFEQAGKHLLTVGQGIPSVPQSHEAALASRLHGMIDDSTWGMGFDDPCFSTGKQMAYLMINPSWNLSTLLQWGWNSSTLGNPFWWAPVGTTEPSRRHYYDRAWRAVLEPSGRYHSIHTYGYRTNGGASFTMSPNDWQEWWRLEERHSLLSPESPLGSGVVLSTSRWANSDRTEFSGGGKGGDELDGYITGLGQTIRRLHEAGVDVSFVAPAAALDKWPANAPLILLNPDECSPGEISSLRALARRGVRIVAFCPESKTVPADAADLSGPVLAVTDAARAGRDTNLLIGKAYDQVDAAEMNPLGPALRRSLHVPVEFPRGCAGYGFGMGKQRYTVVEDWREEARVASVRYRPEHPLTGLHAVSVNDHGALQVRREGDEWLIDVPTRPGDGNLICLEESAP